MPPAGAARLLTGRKVLRAKDFSIPPRAEHRSLLSVSHDSTTEKWTLLLPPRLLSFQSSRYILACPRDASPRNATTEE